MIDHDPHISDLRWDRLLAGELANDERARVLVHAAGCDRCAARQRELEAARRAVAGPPIDLRIAGALRSKRSHVRWTAPLTVIAAAAAALVIVLGRPGGTPDGERTKGEGPSLMLAAGPPGQLVPVASGDVVRPGDYLQAGYTSKRDGFGAVIARDGAAVANVYVPSARAEMVALPAAIEGTFPGSTVLDDVLGDERIAIVWCERALPLAPMLAALRARSPIAAPPGCTVRELALTKQDPR